MSRSTASLPHSFKRLPELADEEILDAILVAPRSSGTLALPGSYSRADPPGECEYEIREGETRVLVERMIMGTPDRYHVMFRVENHRNTPVSVLLRRPSEPSTLVPSSESVADRRRI